MVSEFYDSEPISCARQALGREAVHDKLGGSSKAIWDQATQQESSRFYGPHPGPRRVGEAVPLGPRVILAYPNLPLIPLGVLSPEDPVCTQCDLS